MTSLGCHSVKVLSTTVGYSLVATVTDPCHHLTYDSRGAWHILPQIICEMLPAIEKIAFFPLVHVTVPIFITGMVDPDNE